MTHAKRIEMKKYKEAAMRKESELESKRIQKSTILDSSYQQVFWWVFSPWNLGELTWINWEHICLLSLLPSLNRQAASWIRYCTCLLFELWPCNWNIKLSLVDTCVYYLSFFFYDCLGNVSKTIIKNREKMIIVKMQRQNIIWCHPLDWHQAG